VERGGTKLVDILHKANPWAGEACNRKGCLLCRTKQQEGKTNGQDCKKRNCVYETMCLTCRDRQDRGIEERQGDMGTKKVEEAKRKASRYIYVGETNRSVYERRIEHVNDIAACKTSSHMLRHLLDVHEHEEGEWDQIRFGMRIIKNTRSAFERQISESVMIQKSRWHNIMNIKSKYNRCAIPRLTTKLGEKDLERWRDKDRIEMEKEAGIEEKIRERKKPNQRQEESRTEGWSQASQVRRR
jgi:hypothetical protein